MNRRQFLNTSASALAASFVMSKIAKADDGPIKIGSVISVTGPSAYLGDPIDKTLKLYVPKINAMGGVLGRKLELVIYDDAGDANKGNTFTKRLLDADKVDVLIAGNTTGVSMAILPLAESREVPFISLAGGRSIIEPVRKWVFKVPATDKMAAERVFAHIKSQALKKLAILSETSGFGKSGRAAAVEVAKNLGLEVVADESYGPKDTDMLAQLTNIRGSGAEAVYIIGTNPGTAIATKNFRQLSLSQALYHANGVTSDEFIRLSGGAAEGVIAPSSPLSIVDQLQKDDPQYTLLTDYDKAYREAYNEPAVVYGGGGLDGLLLYIDAVKRAGSTEKTAVRDAIEKTQNFVTTAGIVNMTADDHLGLDERAFRLVTVKDGRWTPLAEAN